MIFFFSFLLFYEELVIFIHRIQMWMFSPFLSLFSSSLFFWSAWAGRRHSRRGISSAPGWPAEGPTDADQCASYRIHSREELVTIIIQYINNGQNHTEKKGANCFFSLSWWYVQLYIWLLKYISSLFVGDDLLQPKTARVGPKHFFSRFRAA